MKVNTLCLRVPFCYRRHFISFNISINISLQLEDTFTSNNISHFKNFYKNTSYVLGQGIYFPVHSLLLFFTIHIIHYFLITRMFPILNNQGNKKKAKSSYLLGVFISLIYLLRVTGCWTSTLSFISSTFFFRNFLLLTFQKRTSLPLNTLILRYLFLFNFFNISF